MKITELVAGDTVLGWMKLGIALVPTRTKTGELQYVVPVRKRRAIAGTLSAFTGVVSSNNVGAKVLNLHVAPMNMALRPFQLESSAIVSIHYSALGRMRLLSKTVFEAREEVASPTNKASYSGTAFKPYHTLTEVELV